MIHSVLIFNKDAMPRLMKFYTPIDLNTQTLLLRQVFQLISSRPANQCSFLTPPPLLEGIEDVRVIYRHYATLYFVFIVDEQESELGILDLIQVFVECLDKCFQNVCELDLVFGWQVLETVLEELVQGGLVVDTNLSKIVAAVDNFNGATGSSGSASSSSTSGFGSLTAASNAFSNAFQQMASNRGVWSGR
ncbi:Aps3 protein [Saccharomycopsis crataegensis]|uniref:AP-3 complex subunit sigma n=1 Tax=Saccharomycopsis crataegensis TaxID=43959 RepID=A0AAV5QP24_9ASCO|nr:Aps3 protein [Saccharomycopsis crataegensis]